MSYPIFFAVGALIAFLILIGGLFILVRSRWILGWIKGSFGLLMVLGAVFGFFALFDLSSYRALNMEQNLATVSFEQLSKQRFKAMVSVSNDETWEYELAGDMWQMDVRIITWKGPLAVMGMLPAYRLDRLSGRYLTVEDENDNERTAYSFHDQKGLDAWAMMQKVGGLGLIDASYGSATYMPMRHGALYAVGLAAKGLVARPINEPAKEALQQWK
ncbi:hypothetical protein [Gynuella sunshinyii]|nr:hypothetical protein [Gynuella sunshinyii]